MNARIFANKMRSKKGNAQLPTTTTKWAMQRLKGNFRLLQSARTIANSNIMNAFGPARQHTNIKTIEKALATDEQCEL